MDATPLSETLSIAAICAAESGPNTFLPSKVLVQSIGAAAFFPFDRLQGETAGYLQNQCVGQQYFDVRALPNIYDDCDDYVATVDGYIAPSGRGEGARAYKYEALVMDAVDFWHRSGAS